MKKEVSVKTKVDQYLIAARIMKKYYENGFKEDYIANLWMFALWAGLQQLSLLKKTEIDEEIERLKRNNEWPINRPIECTQKKSYMIARNDLYGRIVDWIYMHSHTVIGFRILRVFSLLHKYVKR